MNLPIGWRAAFVTRQCWMLGYSLVMVIGGCQQGGPPRRQMPPPQVVVATPLRETVVEWDEFVGRIEPVESVEVRARVSGFLKSTHFAEGQIVKAGDLLAVVDPRPFEAEAKKSEADLLQARARAVQARATVKQAAAEEVAAGVRLDLANKTVERYRLLAERKTVSQEELDVRESDFAQAVANRDAAIAKRVAAEADAGTADAAIETAEANLSIAKLNIEYTRVSAPVTGRVSRRYVTEGNLISGGTAESTLLTTLVSQNPIHCYFDADEQAFLKYARLAREGTRKSSREVRNPVYLALSDETTGFPHKGQMDFVDNRIDAQTGTMRGRAIFPNDDQTLTPGLFARVRIPGSGRYEALLLPDHAIATDQAEKFVFVVDDKGSPPPGDQPKSGTPAQPLAANEGIAHRRTVVLGPMIRGLRVIRSGIGPDDRVIIRGGQKVYPESKVVMTVETLSAKPDDLPSDSTPVPESEWLVPPRPVAAESVPETAVPQTGVKGGK